MIRTTEDLEGFLTRLERKYERLAEGTYVVSMGPGRPLVAMRVAAPVRWLFLNYHYHRAHHRHPRVPWLYLGRYVDEDVPRPSFLSIWLSMWRGPRPLPATAEER